MILLKVDFQNKKLLERTEIEESDLVESKPTEVKPYSEVKERLIARFGDMLPAHFKAAMNAPQRKPYMHGDVHNVQYRVKQGVKHFNKPMPVPCDVTTFSCVKIKGILQLGSQCEKGIDEPFPWMDIKYQVTLNFLKSLPDNTFLVIHTRSDLVAHNDYIRELKRLNVSVNILYTTEDDSVNRIDEPGAPSFKRRKKAVEVLKSQGIVAQLKQHNVKVKKDIA